MMMIATPTMVIDRVIADLTLVKNLPAEKVFLYGRPAGFMKGDAVKWLVWHPYTEKPVNAEAIFLKGQVTATREGESPDHLLEVPLAAVKVNELERLILDDVAVARIKRNIEQQRFLG